MELHILTFSPTGTSRKVAEGIARGIDSPVAHMIDITHKEAGQQVFGDSQPLLVSLPVYGGHVAPMALKRMEGIRGSNTPAIAVVVYGNRHYEQALEELAAFLSERGFRIVAAGTFVG
mgnify:FL=1